MEIKKEDFDKLSDIDKIKINSFLVARYSNINAALIIASVFLAFSLNNLLQFRIISALLFLIIGFAFFNAGTKKSKETINEIQEKYFTISIKPKRRSNK